MKIAIITAGNVGKYSGANGFDELKDLTPFLIQKGLDINEEIWDNSQVDWSQYDLAILKTPWDYTYKFDLFRLWLNNLQNLKVKLLNGYDTVRWNFDKKYLKEIQLKGYLTVPSVHLEKNWNGEIMSLFDSLSSDEIVIKPCISAGSKNTVKFNRMTVKDSLTVVEDIIADGDTIVQPFIQEINNGELSFVFFNGQYSHTVLKKPKSGDFRVQQFLGGTIEPFCPNEYLINTVSSYVAEFSVDTFYSRVDGVIIDGKFVLMELELIEPFLYLAYDANAPQRYYEALMQQIEKHSF
ncbi:hypothetical protein INP83_12120 [Mucilaginibacter sp. 21P]|uniref:ATP-grasp domain-containing protein n=1 Tax=Mucilaginibacter sp. 21P TaxID=2778902 RepID=UPI001C595FC2|nr:hypothetical protein [Mucilaginibacter sp. 21P]QXV63851.1 hypothetical protein INP83_12120 [Mucilaginibacter sp. 21P]